jgi:CheY-like chemotaxis protein
LEQSEIILPKGQDEIILVVEDNEGVRSLIQKKLQKLNYKVLTATNGKDALKIVEDMNDEIKLVITDLVMPVMGGVELSRLITSKHPSIKIVALTGYPLGSETEDMQNAGIIEYIQKPFKGRTLVEVLCRALEKA